MFPPKIEIGELVFKSLAKTSRGRRMIRLAKDLTIAESGSMGVFIRVLAGFESDGATIPLLLWWFLPPDGPYLLAAVVHDHLYRRGGSRFLADALFLHIMRSSMRSDRWIVRLWYRLQQRLLYTGVRWFGWVIWLKYHGKLDTLIVEMDGGEDAT